MGTEGCEREASVFMPRLGFEGTNLVLERSKKIHCHSVFVIARLLFFKAKTFESCSKAAVFFYFSRISLTQHVVCT
jgi:hypothetical protein